MEAFSTILGHLMESLSCVVLIWQLLFNNGKVGYITGSWPLFFFCIDDLSVVSVNGGSFNLCMRVSEIKEKH